MQDHIAGIDVKLRHHPTSLNLVSKSSSPPPLDIPSDINIIYFPEKNIQIIPIASLIKNSTLSLYSSLSLC